jgi:hypothetical protein
VREVEDDVGELRTRCVDGSGIVAEVARDACPSLFERLTDDLQRLRSVGRTFTFARQSDGSNNDWASLREFIRRFRASRGSIFVIEPFPDPLCELLHKKLPRVTVVPVPVMWNLLSGAFIDCGRSVTERYHELDWRHESADPPRRERQRPRYRYRRRS